MCPLLDREPLVVVAHRLEDLRGPPCLAELHADVLRTIRKFDLERLANKLTHRRISAFHKQPLELNHDLNDFVRFGSAFGRKNAGILQRSQYGH